MSTLLAGHPYTATDDAAGVTSDSLAAWQRHRSRFGSFIRADLAQPFARIGPAYAEAGGALIHPTLILTDEHGNTLALNGVGCGYHGEGPRGAARILSVEGLLDPRTARDQVASMRAGTITA